MENNPYQTPAASLEAPTVSGVSGTYGAFRQNGVLKSILATLLVVESMAMIFSGGVLNYLGMQQYQSDEYQLADEPSQLDEIITLTDSLHSYFILIIMVIFGIWINRACKNAWLLDPPRMGITPGWSVGYYFLPILSLWKPYVSMKQIRSASYGSDHALRNVLPAWWTLWLVSALIGSIIAWLYYNADTEEGYLMTFKLTFVSTAINVALNYIAVILITGITRAQNRRVNQWHA